MYCVFNKTAESFLGLNITCASSAWARLKGVLGRFHFRSTQGLWFVRSRGIHTIGSPRPVDIVYLDVNTRVIDIVEHAGPFRLWPLRWKCHSVLELPPHTIYASNTKIGDQLLIFMPQQMESYLKERNAPWEQESAS
jgi:uncharacterized membrane protein (UPF0127 family)